MESIFTERPNIRSFIIDSEIVAIDPLNGELKSFQELSNRARKDVELSDIRVSVCIFAFDLMYFNGEVSCEFMTKTLAQRRSRYCWRNHFAREKGYFIYSFRHSNQARKVQLSLTTSRAAKAQRAKLPFNCSGSEQWQVDVKD